MQKISFQNSQNLSYQNKAQKSEIDKKNTDIKHKAYATVSSFAPSVPIFFAHNFFTNSIFKKMFNVAKNLNEEEIKTLNGSIDRILAREDLSKSIQIKNITSKTSLSDFLKPPLTIQNLQQVQQGSNAFFDGGNAVYVNRELAPNLIFHELGHAHNNKFSVFSRKMLRFYKASQVAPFVIAFLSLFLNEEKPKEGKELTKFQKIKNTVRKTLPFLAASASLPMLIEEGRATLKANKWVRELFTPELAKKVTRGYKFGFLTYLAIPTSAFLISFLGMKYKDFVASETNNPKKMDKNIA